MPIIGNSGLSIKSTLTVRYGFAWILGREFRSALYLSWAKIAQTLRSAANPGRTDGEYATTASLLDRPLEIDLKAIQGTGTSPTSAVRPDLASDLLVLLNPIRSKQE